MELVVADAALYTSISHAAQFASLLESIYENYSHTTEIQKFCRPTAGPCLIQCGLGQALLPYQVASSSIQPFGQKDMGWKLRGCAPSRGGAVTPSDTTSPGPRFTSIPRGILIHPAIWPQQTWAKTSVGAVTFFLGGAESLPNKKSPGQRPTSIPTGILVHPAVWPQRTWA